MGKYGITWENLRKYGKIWEDMRKYGKYGENHRNQGMASGNMIEGIAPLDAFRGCIGPGSRSGSGAALRLSGTSTEQMRAWYNHHSLLWWCKNGQNMEILGYPE